MRRRAAPDRPLGRALLQPRNPAARSQDLATIKRVAGAFRRPPGGRALRGLYSDDRPYSRVLNRVRCTTNTVRSGSPTVITLTTISSIPSSE